MWPRTYVGNRLRLGVLKPVHQPYKSSAWRVTLQAAVLSLFVRRSNDGGVAVTCARCVRAEHVLTSKLLRCRCRTVANELWQMRNNANAKELMKADRGNKVPIRGFQTVGKTSVIDKEPCRKLVDRERPSCFPPADRSAHRSTSPRQKCTQTRKEPLDLQLVRG
jgi:hypothetical protein